MIQFIFAFACAIALIVVVGLFLKNMQQRGIIRGQDNIFQLEGVFHIDQKRKIVSIRRAKKVYVLLIGNGEALIDIVENEKDNPIALDFKSNNL